MMYTCGVLVTALANQFLMSCRRLSYVDSWFMKVDLQ